VQSINGPSLSVLPCAASREETYELLTSPRLAELINEARIHFDYVIIDTPPMIPVQDSGLLRSAVDGYIVVVSANSTPRQLVAEVLNRLDPAVCGIGVQPRRPPAVRLLQNLLQRVLAPIRALVPPPRRSVRWSTSLGRSIRALCRPSTRRHMSCRMAASSQVAHRNTERCIAIRSMRSMRVSTAPALNYE